MNLMTTEVELKFKVDGVDKLDALMRALPKPESSFIQTNNYLDDEAGSLRAAGIMLRAREVRLAPDAPPGLGKPPVTFTAKVRLSKDNGLFVSEERAQVMPLDAWMEIKDKGLPIPTDGPLFRWLLGQTAFGPLRVVGETVNLRHLVRSDLFLLEIDHTRFPDGSQELEIECETILPDQARVHIEKLLGGLGISFSPQTEGKYARFLQKTGA
jgi:uncharacterized protein YjbK